MVSIFFRSPNQELKGNVTGESTDGSGRQELIYLYKRPSWYGHGDIIENPVFQHLTNYKENVPCTNSANHIKNWDYNWLDKKCITHEVIVVDRVNEYAIIQLNQYRTSICDVCNLAHISLACQNPREIDNNIPSYFLCGINTDDQFYFLHPLFDLPKSLINAAKIYGDVMSIVNWCNKEDLGFEGRIQGDVIFTEVEPKLSETAVDRDYNIDYVRYDFTVAEKSNMYIRLDLKNTSMEKTKVGDWPHDLKNLTDYIKNHGRLQHIIIGNRHELNTDGIITRLASEGWPTSWQLNDASNTFAILGSELVMSHPEHPTVKRQIPADKALLVSIQRGSNRIMYD